MLTQPYIHIHYLYDTNLVACTAPRDAVTSGGGRIELAPSLSTALIAAHNGGGNRIEGVAMSSQRHRERPEPETILGVGTQPFHHRNLAQGHRSRSVGTPKASRPRSNGRRNQDTSIKRRGIHPPAHSPSHSLPWLQGRRHAPAGIFSKGRHDLHLQTGEWYGERQQKTKEP